jgi:hypothetical protein
MRRAAIAVLAFIVSGLAFADAPTADKRIPNSEAKRIVRKTFAAICGSDADFRCPYALEDRPTCSFEAIVLLPLGEHGAYDGRSRPAWVSLSGRGEVLRISYDRATVCPIA